MTDASGRWRTTAAGFTRRVDAVPPPAWDQPSPCEGWAARDIVGHLVEWVPSFLRDGAGIEIAAGPGVDLDPAGAWRTLEEGITDVLDDADPQTRLIALTGRHP